MEKKEIKFPLNGAITNEAGACQKGMVCLEKGPSCRIGAVLNKEMLIVDCRDGNTTCPYYQRGASESNGNNRGLCTCRVRLTLWEKYNL